MATAVMGFAYMPSVLSSQGSGLSYPDCQQMIHAASFASQILLGC